MNSLKTVTKYETVSEGILEWEIQNVGLHFKKCDPCWDGADAATPWCQCDFSLNMNSDLMQLPAGEGKQTKWKFGLMKHSGAQNKTFSLNLKYEGLFLSDGSKADENVNFQYNGVLVMESSMMNRAETVQIICGTESTAKMSSYSQQVYFAPVQISQLKKVWPNGNLKVTATISHLTERINKLFNIANGQYLNSLDLQDDQLVPLGNCYGNLMNNPDLADFTIICQGTPFHAHKFILSVRSRVFRTMIESGLSETCQNEQIIQDMTPQTVKLMLEFIYKGTVQCFPVDLKEKIRLLDCAEKYELNGLKSICMRQIFSNLPTEKDVGELAMAAFTYGANERVKKVIRDFCTKNFEKLIQNLEYKKLFLANPQAFIN